MNDQQKGWEAAVAEDHGNSATPSFFVVIANKKVAVYLDQTDDNAAWKVDTSAFTIASDATIGGSLSMAADRIAKDYGVVFDAAELGLVDEQNIYLNASESDIQDLLTASSLDEMNSSAAFDFGFYTQVKDANGNFINVAVKAEEISAITWQYDEDGEVLVQTDYNTIDTASNGSAAVGGTGADFIELGAGSGNIAMGNAGSDTYVVDAGDSGIINELGNITNASAGSTTTPESMDPYQRKAPEFMPEYEFEGVLRDDLTLQSMEEVIGDDDSVKFELVEDIADLNFSRGEIAGEGEGSTLFIDAGDKGAATLFDQYNDFLSFGDRIPRDR